VTGEGLAPVTWKLTPRWDSSTRTFPEFKKDEGEKAFEDLMWNINFMRTFEMSLHSTKDRIVERYTELPRLAQTWLENRGWT
jgi:hypothetical protein